MTKQIDIYTKVLQESGFRMTASRRAIIATLIASEGHVSADQLADMVHQDRPRVGRMTVYRTLELLSDLGLIRPVYQGSAAAHYILMDDGHHHHMVCSQCRRVVEFNQCVLKEVEKTITSRYSFEIQGHFLEIYGLCTDCQK